MLHIPLSQLPAQFRSSDYYRICTEDYMDEDEDITAPEECTRLNPEITNTDDLVHLLRTMMFWGFDHIPNTVRDYMFYRCQNALHFGDGRDFDHSLFVSILEQLLEQVPDLKMHPVYDELCVILNEQTDQNNAMYNYNSGDRETIRKRKGRLTNNLAN